MSQRYHSEEIVDGRPLATVPETENRQSIGIFLRLRSALGRRALQVLITARTHEKQTTHEQTNKRESQSARLRGGYRTRGDVQLHVIEIDLASVSSEFNAEEPGGNSGAG